MYIVPLKNIPNQQLALRVDGADFDITIKYAGGLSPVADLGGSGGQRPPSDKEARGCMLFSLRRDGQAIVDSVRCAPMIPLIPYAYLEGDAGNFCFTTQDDAYAHYSRFGGQDILHYMTAAELAAIRRTDGVLAPPGTPRVRDGQSPIPSARTDGVLAPPGTPRVRDGQSPIPSAPDGRNI